METLSLDLKSGVWSLDLYCLDLEYRVQTWSPDLGFWNPNLGPHMESGVRTWKPGLGVWSQDLESGVWTWESKHGVKT